MRTPTLILTLTLIAACGGGDEPEDPATEVCAHLGDTGAELTATATRSAAPAITVSDKPWKITLPAQQKSHVKISNSGDNALLLAVDTAAVVNGLLFGDIEQTLGAPAPLAGCADTAPEHFDLDLEETGDYFLVLGPSVAQTVQLMLVLGEGHGDE